MKILQTDYDFKSMSQTATNFLSSGKNCPLYINFIPLMKKKYKGNYINWNHNCIYKNWTWQFFLNLLKRSSSNLHFMYLFRFYKIFSGLIFPFSTELPCFLGNLQMSWNCVLYNWLKMLWEKIGIFQCFIKPEKVGVGVKSKENFLLKNQTLKFKYRIIYYKQACQNVKFSIPKCWVFYRCHLQF